MSAKVWGGVLLGVFIAAAGAEIVRRKCPGLFLKIKNRTIDITDTANKTVKDFSSSAGKAFKEGFDSAKIG